MGDAVAVHKLIEGGLPLLVEEVAEVCSVGAQLLCQVHEAQSRFEINLVYGEEFLKLF